MDGLMVTSQTAHSKGARFWFIDGEAYDLTNFYDKHPGGAIWFKLNVNRDISVLFHTYHLQPSRLLPMLKKYKVEDQNYNRDSLNPKLGIPPFLLSKNFDARKDIPTYDFTNEDHLLPTVRRELQTSESRAAVKFYNELFDALCIVAIGLYLLNWVGFLGGFVPQWLSILVFVILRTSFGGWGHYYVHAKKPNWGETLFDANYVGTCLTGFDGHVMLHHAYTHSGADIKTRLFSGMWNLPLLYRMPAFTLHKLGQLLSGMIIRAVEFEFTEFKPSDFHISFWFMRGWLLLEFWGSVFFGLTVPYLVQFFITLWFNTFLVLSSHDFERFEHEDCPREEDWGLFQVRNSYDLTLVFNKWVDVFLSAGLSPHRAHHLLPYQCSGFANIYSESIIKKHLPKYGIPWEKPKVFWTERVPAVFRFCFLTPTKDMEKIPVVDQHFMFDSIVRALKYVISGFMGIGSI